MEKRVKFGVFADLHMDIMHDAKRRLEDFLAACRLEQVDFIVQLGDFCQPKPANDVVAEMFRDFEKPAFHVMGNHDADKCTKEQTFRYYGTDCGLYYSFDMGGFHFIVLDVNYYKMDGKYFSYENGNYFAAAAADPSSIPYLPPDELDWLQKDLARTKLPSILFSHQSLRKSRYHSVKNREEVREILENAPSGVLASLNGHEHIDDAVRQGKIWYVNVNSMSNVWLGEEYVCPGRYGKEIDARYPNIKYTAPYRDALYGIVTAEEKGMWIKGRHSEFVGTSPYELGVIDQEWFPDEYAEGRRMMRPCVEDRFLSFEE